MPRKVDPPNVKVLKAALRKLHLRYTACINMKHRWENKAETVAHAFTKLQTTIREIERSK
jgi:hypothetical protein